MKRLFLLTTALMASAVAATSALLAGPAVAQDDPFNWSGFYFGGGVGIVESRGSSDITYGGNGWTDDGAFTGDIFEDVDGVGGYVRGLGPLANYAVDLDSPSSADNPEGFADTAKTSETQAFGAVFAGGQWQVPDTGLVLGGEVRANFGSFGSSSSEDWTARSDDRDAATCRSAFLGCGVLNTAVGLRFQPNWTGSGSTGFFDTLNLIGNGKTVEISGEVNQNIAMSFGTSFDKSFSALARVGVPADRALIYGLAGPTIARVTASTSATVEESGEVTVAVGNRTATYTGSETYQWDGSVTENRVGFTFGAGVDYAVTDNILLRGEVSYTNLGSISVTGTSADTSSTYTVSQHIGSAQALAGVMFKF